MFIIVLPTQVLSLTFLESQASRQASTGAIEPYSYISPLLNLPAYHVLSEERKPFT